MLQVRVMITDFHAAYTPQAFKRHSTYSRLHICTPNVETREFNSLEDMHWWIQVLYLDLRTRKRAYLIRDDRFCPLVLQPGGVFVIHEGIGAGWILNDSGTRPRAKSL